MNQWAQLAENLRKRDEDHVRQVNNEAFYSGGIPLERQLEIANARAMDALKALLFILRHLAEQEDARSGGEEG